MAAARSESQRAVPVSLIAAAAVASAITALPIWLATRGVPYTFPDYGDLWRWSTLLHYDGSLPASELFSETNLLGHNHVLTIWLSNAAATSYDYSLLWGFGFVGILLSAGSLAFFTSRSVGELQSGTRVAAVVGVLVALLAFRFDESSPYFSSLLVFEQFFYFFALAALLVGARMQAQSVVDGTVSWKRYFLLGVLLLMGEAPSALSAAALLGLAIVIALASRKHQHVLGVIGAILGGVIVKWLLRELFGGRSAPNGPSSALGFLDYKDVPKWLKLLGSSVRDLAGARGNPTPDTAYLVLGIVIFAGLVLGLAFAAYEVYKKDLDFHRGSLLFAGILLVAFATLASMLIVDTRGLNGRYDLGRFIRSTQFAMPGMALIGLGLPLVRVTRMRALAVAFGCALLLLTRVGPALEVQDAAPFIRRANATYAARVCDPPTGEIDWKTVWPNLADGRAAVFEDSPLLAEWRKQRCPIILE